jgi:hypothetical protein
MVSVKTIQSKDNPLLVRLRKRLNDPAGYRKSGEVVLEGDHLGQALLKRGGRPQQVVITQEAWQAPQLQALAMQADAVSVVSSELMKSLSALETPLAHSGRRCHRGSGPLARCGQCGHRAAQCGGLWVHASGGAQGLGRLVVTQSAACWYGRTFRFESGRSRLG